MKTYPRSSFPPKLLSLFLPIGFLLLISLCQAQAPTVPTTQKNTTNNQYKDFICDGETIWALTTKGKLALFNANDSSPVPQNVKTGAAVTALAIDKKGNIVVGDKSNTLKQYNKITNTWTPLFQYENNLLAITFDSRNNCYLITDKGIYDPTLKKYFNTESSENYQINLDAGWGRQSALLTDRNDNIWIGFGFGEWGGELLIFNTATRKFIKPNLKDFPITLNPIKSIFENKDHVFVTAGLMHFSLKGSVVQFDNFRSKVIFESRGRRKADDDTTHDEKYVQEYIGPGAYNETDKCLYFYAHNGIFKGDPQNDLSKISQWTKVLEPKLRWSDGQPDAVGSPMNVFKLTFTNAGKMVFVSQNDGIGVYDGNKLILTR